MLKEVIKNKQYKEKELLERMKYADTVKGQGNVIPSKLPPKNYREYDRNML